MGERLVRRAGARDQGFRGDQAIYLTAHKNICLWPSVSAEALDVLEKLIDGERYHFDRADPLVYLHNGLFPQMPIAKRARDYKKMHWLPVIINRRERRR